jgi:hypothetical protein
MAGTLTSAATPQASTPLPFGIGERLSFVVSTARRGKIGEAVMSLTGPVDVRGTPTILASFDTRVRFLLMNGSDETRSWIDPADLMSLRFATHKHGPFSSSTDSVDVFPSLHQWTGLGGLAGTITSDHPLDELSFIYFLRTAVFVPGVTQSFDRHYDTRRNPTTVRVIKRETLRTPAGTFNTVQIEMRVKDGTNYTGEGVLHLWISDDPCHLPVRIESAVPILGTGILTLQRAETPFCPALASRP